MQEDMLQNMNWKYKDLNYKLKDIEKIIPHKAFRMRIQQFVYIHMNGKRGLASGPKSPLYKQLYNIFENFNQQKFAKLVNSILKVKSNLGYCYIIKLIQHVCNT